MHRKPARAGLYACSGGIADRRAQDPPGVDRVVALLQQLVGRPAAKVRFGGVAVVGTLRRQQQRGGYDDPLAALSQPGQYRCAVVEAQMFEHVAEEDCIVPWQQLLRPRLDQLAHIADHDVVIDVRVDRRDVVVPDVDRVDANGPRALVVAAELPIEEVSEQQPVRTGAAAQVKDALRPVPADQVQDQARVFRRVHRHWSPSSGARRGACRAPARVRSARRRLR